MDTTAPPAKFSDPERTADGATRASVDPRRLQTLWINTGTLCNLACTHCYIESTPTNDRLVYINDREVADYLDEIAREDFGTEEIGFTGGEPFMNPHFMTMLADSLQRGHRALVLTNAMRPMEKCADDLLALKEAHGDRLEMRVSIDHYTQALHETERGPRSWKPMIRGLRWLSAHGFNLSAAGRTMWNEDEAAMRDGYRQLFRAQGIAIDADSPHHLILFPEMDEDAPVPEITTACWSILGKRPDDIMCASSRMVIKRKGEAQPVVAACTLLPYDPQFEMGRSLGEAWRPVRLNHPHCAKFCVLGGGACSAG
ncbi:radical SAM protein [Algiphilus sp. NNCM1]|uniref:radical SAM protein n=1 Tax=Algiphilus sp. TaxID=1872431 RepID=UPI001CA73511|nr:radical SAM protein [Algiphilus sp.]MBY8966144.1 radical SAM protein [Algiphilus acroporae]MCI5103504.1 radical SAM protein [Algiphilus sp.]